MKKYNLENINLVKVGKGYYIEVDDKILNKTLSLAVTKEELKNLQVLLNKIFKEGK